MDKDFWHKRREVNAQKAIFHQWDQLLASGCIENFRIAAGEVAGWRTGWFFADSDAYKWLEAASRINGSQPDTQLENLIAGFVDLLSRAQMSDGYLFTYNQIHFPGIRWQNLQIEHELYCHGHLIEAGVTDFEVTGRTNLLSIARRAADRIVADFSGKGPLFTPGHEEIEIALLRLHQITPGDTSYRALARQFIEQRGRIPHFALELLRQNRQVGQRTQQVNQQKLAYQAAHPDYQPAQLPPGNRSKKPYNATLRWYASVLSGKYFQQHAPVREQTIPVGHAVRFAYWETAAAMLARVDSDMSLLPAIEQAWEHMLMRRMYVTGGIGSLPGLEGFGDDYELDPELAYAETCAALAGLFWNWEMAALTRKAKYSDLFEWQLYNAAAAGMGQDGTRYLYNNPLACHGGVARQPWYAVACCPSNLSRTWADLDRYIFSSGPNQAILHQYISIALKNVSIPCNDGGWVKFSFELDSAFPWEGHARLTITDLITSDPEHLPAFDLRLRKPEWASSMHVFINNQDYPLPIPTPQHNPEPPASGYDPRRAIFQEINRHWTAGDSVEVRLEMPINLRRAHPRLKGHRSKVAVTRGPLVYCLESVDNPSIDLFTSRLDPVSLTAIYDSNLLDGIVKITGRTREGMPVTFIPYYLWGNRGPSQMTVWVNT